MIRKTYRLETITPCFCAGAEPDKAEIRAASIRGQLRWWFRVLGGSREQESIAFGNVAGENTTGSAYRIAVTDFQRGPIWKPPTIDPNAASNYVWHFASVSGKPVNAGRATLGPRWQAHGALPPASTFNLVITRIRDLKPDAQRRFDIALDAFLVFGALGLRSTRGLGAFFSHQASPWQELITPLSEAGFQVAPREETIGQESKPKIFPSWEAALADWGAWLKFKLRKENKAKTFSALGGINPRQASAVRFRPIRIAPSQFIWVGLEAPHKKVLARATSPILNTKYFSGATPVAPARHRH
jgi:CRISPR-associated protein Cmr1